MTAPIAARYVAAAAGALIVLSTVASVVGTVIVPRKSGSKLTRLVASGVNGIFGLIVRPVPSYRWRDRILAGQAAVILLRQLAGWPGSVYVGYALLIWPATSGISTAFRSVGPALWTFGSPDTHGFFETAVLDTAAMAGLITITLQIAYLPALYAAFNRRENEIALLNSRAGTPSWGPELLARTHYALGSGTSTLDTLPEFYNEWERWAADITESHVTYLPLVWFRSPSYEASWVTSLLAVLDSAALYLSLCPPALPAPCPAAAPCPPGPAVPTQRAGVLLRSGPLHGHQGAGRACPARRHQPHLRRIPRRRWQARGGDVPDRA